MDLEPKVMLDGSEEPTTVEQEVPTLGTISSASQTSADRVVAVAEAVPEGGYGCYDYDSMSSDDNDDEEEANAVVKVEPSMTIDCGGPPMLETKGDQNNAQGGGAQGGLQQHDREHG